MGQSDDVEPCPCHKLLFRWQRYAEREELQDTTVARVVEAMRRLDAGQARGIQSNLRRSGWQSELFSGDLVHSRLARSVPTSSLIHLWSTYTLPAISFSFYHFACIMLLRYKPGPKFAIRNVGRSSETDVSAEVSQLELRLLIYTGRNPVTCSSHMRCQQELTGDWTTGDHSVPHHLHLGPTGVRPEREK